MLEIIENFNKALDMDREKLKEIDLKIEIKKEKIERLKAQIDKLEKQRVKIICSRNWIKSVIEPLAKELAKRTGLHWEIYGPFGLNAETSIYLRENMKLNITQQKTQHITLIPDNLKDRTYICRYYTGEKTSKYPKGSIGELNGLNNITAILPDTIEEIEKLLITSERNKERE